ncbi:MAG: efflux RND transporter periplasmic adaptor subunit, partial [Paracoccus sp. (in: a-proteobacteria)]|nr:efflux RND transporter periplasmic adaptor subunit [Paracoccus sp. (in: a-proteobacteria)]
TEMLVDEGDNFAQGDVLARIDPLQLEQALNAAAAALDAARASEDQAGQAADRAQAMLDRGVGTRAALDAARQARSEAETAVRQAESALDQARRLVADTNILAPFDGVVLARAGEPGQVVGAAQTVLSLAAQGGIEAVFQTPDLSYLEFLAGHEVELTTIEVSAPPMLAHVNEISPLVDAMTGSVRVRALVENAPDDIGLLGASVRGTMVLRGGETIALPWMALTSDAGQPAVWVVDAAGRAQLRVVEIGRFDDGSILVADGIAPGEQVVAAGSQMLYPGREVTDAALAGGGQ